MSNGLFLEIRYWYRKVTGSLQHSCLLTVHPPQEDTDRTPGRAGFGQSQCGGGEGSDIAFQVAQATLSALWA